MGLLPQMGKWKPRKERGWAMYPVSEAGGPAHFLSKLPFQAVSVLVERLQGQHFVLILLRSNVLMLWEW